LKRESISEGTIEANLEDALDTLGIFDDRTPRPYRSNGPPFPSRTSSGNQQQQQQQREREFLDNPLAPTTANTNLRTSLLVGASRPGSDSRDLESGKEDSPHGSSFGSHPGVATTGALATGGGGSSSVSSSHHLSMEGSEFGRQSETEFRLFLDRDPQSIEKKRRSHPKTNSSSSSNSPQGPSPGPPRGEGGGDGDGLRDRIKRNLSIAFGSNNKTKERFRHLLQSSHGLPPPPSGSSPSPSSPLTSIPNDFIFKDYLPQVFAEVRETCEINSLEYFEAFQKTTKEKFSEGRSGAFLYFSSNQKFIVKTTTKNEINSLLKIMKDYLSYLIANPNSLLVRFLGAHSLTMYGRVLYFVVMLNVFQKAELSERYDLKGSWVQRHGDDFVSRKLFKTKSNRSGGGGATGGGGGGGVSAPLYKDNDLQHKIILNPEVANALHDQIFRDTAFLTGKIFILFLSPLLFVSLAPPPCILFLCLSSNLFPEPHLPLFLPCLSPQDLVSWITHFLLVLYEENLKSWIVTLLPFKHVLKLQLMTSFNVMLMVVCMLLW
jgi:hypothetical protein